MRPIVLDRKGKAELQILVTNALFQSLNGKIPPSRNSCKTQFCDFWERGSVVESTRLIIEQTPKKARGSNPLTSKSLVIRDLQ